MSTSERGAARKRRPRLIIVSNRLPYSVCVEGNDARFEPSSGGLVSGLRAFLDRLPELGGGVPREFAWIGWPGATIDPPLQERVRDESLSHFHAHPVFLGREEMDAFYLGFCNKTVWPLFHYFPSRTVYQESMWREYQRVNESFCATVLSVVQPDDVVWVHDYHLMLLPRLLRNTHPHLQVGFFFHIPFPSFEIFRLLPSRWRREILGGLLGSDLIGFHTFDYAQHFRQCVLRIHGYEHQMGQILTPERVVRVDTYPMGIDYERFAGASESGTVDREAAQLLETLKNVRVLLSVDRLDYTKGILNRLEGFETLLESHPEYHGKVVLAMCVVPSRIGVDEYELMKRQIEEQIGRINGRFGDLAWTPVVYQYRHVPFDSLVTLYRISHAAIVTPLRDGMNLVAKEYVASQTRESGVLILSEMAGASKELGEAIIVNPNDRIEIAEGMREALEMPEGEQRRRMAIMQERLRSYNVTRWAEHFIGDLLAMQPVQRKYTAKLLGSSEREELIGHYGRSRRRLFLLDHDGSLVPFAPHPAGARPGDQVRACLSTLACDERNRIAIVSGRDRETLDSWFGDLRIGLVAEHGTWIREPGGEWALSKEQSDEWKPQIRAILRLYADRLPGARVEEKSYALVWHYRSADPEPGDMLARELADHLVTFTANIDLQVIQGNKVIEVRSAGVTKGSATKLLLSHAEYDFVLAIGDDRTDEEIFRSLPEEAYSIKVGIANTEARFNLTGPRQVLKLLEEIARPGRDGR